MKKIILIVLSVFALSACSEVQDIENGQIPEQYLDEVQHFVGEWPGSFNGHMGALKISLNDSNQLIVEFKDGETDDLMPGCDSHIGLLKQVEFKEKNDQVRVSRATFAMDTNKCSRSLLGQQLNFFFNKAQNVAQVKLLKRQWRDYECRIVGQDPNGAPIRQCQYVIREEYLQGQFSVLRN